MPESRKVDAMGHGYVTLVSADGFEFVVRPQPPTRKPTKNCARN